jgi:hypothetical protein
LLSLPSRTARLLIGKIDIVDIVAILQAEVELALTELVAIDSSMFQRANELASLVYEPVTANGNGQHGREDADSDDARFDHDQGDLVRFFYSYQR